MVLNSYLDPMLLHSKSVRTQAPCRCAKEVPLPVPEWGGPTIHSLTTGVSGVSLKSILIYSLLNILGIFLPSTPGPVSVQRSLKIH